MATTKEFTKDALNVKVFETRLAMGRQAARDVSNKIKELLKIQRFVNIIFASAPSQNEFLASLVEETGIEWERINAFHMDEYVGLDKSAPQLFSHYLKDKIFDKLPFKNVYYINGSNPDIEEECQIYSQLIIKNPPDIICMGIGENAHVAFNDPHVAEFDDPLLVKTVMLDEISRQQQVNDGCFVRFDQVPETAITLTVPALMQGKNIYCMVPGINKAGAVYHTFNNKIEEEVPSTALRNHNQVILYLDKESASRL